MSIHSKRGVIDTKKLLMLPRKIQITLVTLCVAVILLTVASCTTKYDFGKATLDEPAAEETVTETEAPTEADIVHPVDASWFNDMAIVGDSVTVMLEYYCDNDPDALGDAMFYCAGSLGYGNAQWDIDDENAVHPVYHGEVHLVEDVIPVTGANKVLITLGMNDIGNFGVEGAFDQAKSLIEKVRAKGPDAVIYIESTTPMVSSAQRETLNNENIRIFNGMLKEYVESQGDGYKFLDFYSVIANENGDLPEEYCSDVDYMGIHFTTDACEKWVEFLKNNV